MTMLYSVLLKPQVSCVDNHYSSFLSCWIRPSFQSSARSYLVNPPVCIIRIRIMLQDVSEAMSNVHAGGASMQAIQSCMRMLSSQAVPHFSHCKVKHIEKVALRATLLQQLYCMSLPTQAQLERRATRFCTYDAARICSPVHLYILLDCSCLLQNIL